jgi:hypothetical protein
MAQFLDEKLHRVHLHLELEEGGEVIPLDGVLDITRCTTAAEVRAKIVEEGLGAHRSLPRPIAEIPFSFLAHDQGTFSVVSRAQESDTKRPVLGPRFALDDDGRWILMLRGSSVLSRAGALDPAQAEVLRGELDRLHGRGGETTGGSGGMPGGADVVGEIADILEDLHEQRDEQGEQRRRVPGACGSRAVVPTVLCVGQLHPRGERGIVPRGQFGPGPDGVRWRGCPCKIFSGTGTTKRRTGLFARIAMRS